VLSSPEAAALLARDLLLTADDNKEHFWAIYLNTQNRYLMHTLVSTGTLSASLVHPREVLGPALREGAASPIGFEAMGSVVRSWKGQNRRRRVEAVPPPCSTRSPFRSDVITNADRWHKRFAFDGGITRRHPVREGGPVQPVDERSPNASIVQRARSDVCVVIELRDLYQDAIARPVRWLGVRRRKE